MSQLNNHLHHFTAQTVLYNTLVQETELTHKPNILVLFLKYIK